MRYWPAPSVIAVRVFSISAGLDASTVTPGSTAPVPSFTTPAIATCARAVAGSRNAAPHTTAAQNTTRRMDVLLKAMTDWSVSRPDNSTPDARTQLETNKAGGAGRAGRAGTQPVNPKRRIRRAGVVVVSR